MFTIRVYGLVFRDDHVLVTREPVAGKEVLKFPGGGLEFGEGTLETLHREFREETGLGIQVVGHIYTTDFFVRSFLSEEDQVISIYYEVDLPGHDGLHPVPAPLPDQYFDWLSWRETDPALFSFPIDREVISRLQSGSLSRPL